ncbi:TIGR01621 family pseudouridine synthase [Vibrio sp.]|uniref:TIGR01621 family pseudouridine synthase n=1 Tax=Vibrio sp. TaxID=678 RepID=UPI003D12FBA2
MYQIIYTHPDFVVINKFPGVSVHKDDGDTMLVSDVAKQLGEDNLYLVHRLDKMTSGLLLLARSANAARGLAGLFAQRQVGKFYLAIGSKKPKKKQGLVIGDMQRSRRASWKLLPSQDNPAITQFFSAAAEPGERLFVCKPYSGKTHQIRVALKSIGSAIVGDPIYNPSSEADRGYLHAFALMFDWQGERFQFVCDPRQVSDFGVKWQSQPVSTAIDQWLTPWLLQWPTLKQTK